MCLSEMHGPFLNEPFSLDYDCPLSLLPYIPHVASMWEQIFESHCTSEFCTNAAITLFAWLVSQPVNRVFLSYQISTSHQSQTSEQSCVAVQLCSTTENDSSFLCLIIFVSFSWSWILRSGILMLLLSRGTDHVNRQCVLTRSCYLIGKFNLVI